MIEKNGPRAWRRRGHEQKDDSCGILADRFPQCKLHGLNIVAALPQRCPMQAANPANVLLRMKDAAWQELGGRLETADLTGALNTMHQVDECTACISRKMRHATIQRLRQSAACKGATA